MLLAADTLAPFHNANNPLDVTGDQLVTAYDAAWLAMDLLRNGSRSLGVGSLTGSSSGAEGEGGSRNQDQTRGFVDVNGDNYVSPMDMALLARTFASGAGPQVAIIPIVTDANGNVATEMEVGETYTITYNAEDIRNPSDPDFPDLQGNPDNLGVFAAYVDAVFDDTLTIVTPPTPNPVFDHGSIYVELNSGSGANAFPRIEPGRVQDLGGVQDNFGLDGPLGPGQFFVVSFQVVLTDAGLEVVNDTANVDENSTNQFIDVLMNDSINGEITVGTERADGVGKEVLVLLADSTDINSQNVPENEIQRPSVTLDVSDASLQNLRIISGPSNGSAQVVTVNNKLGISYTPTAGFAGTDTLTYEVEDGVGGSATATVEINVGPVNDAPVNSAPTSVTVTEDVLFSFNGGNTISVSDPDAGNGNLDVELSVQNGTISIPTVSGSAQLTVQSPSSLLLVGNLTDLNNSLASLRYQTDLNFDGTDTLQISTDDNGNTGDGGAKMDVDTVTINVTPINDPPVNNLPAKQFVDEETDLVFNSANSNLISITDVDSGSGNLNTTLGVDTGILTLGSTTGVTITSGSNGSGSMTIRGTRTSINNALNGLTYTPPQTFIGDVELSISTNDNGNTGGGSAGVDSDTLDIEVEPTVRPRARNDGFSIIEDDPATDLDVTDNDIPHVGAQVTLEKVNQPASGGTVSINTMGTTTKTDDVVTFTPAMDFVGDVTFTYVIDDTSGLGSSLPEAERTGTVTVTVAERNDAPTANNDSRSTNEDTALTLSGSNLTANDSKGPANESSQTLTVTSVGTASNGTVTLNGGTVVYTPNPNFNGADSFTYTITDNGTTNGVNDFKSSTATVNVTVNAVNDKPVTTADNKTTAEDIPLSFPATDLSGNDNPGGGSDESGQQLTVTAVSSTSANGGTVTLSGGTVTYTPALNYNGPDSFTYTVTDNGTPNASETGTVNVTVTEVNDKPNANDDNDIGIKDFTTTYDVDDLLANDTEGPANESSQQLTVTAVASTSAQGGTVTFNSSTGKITYTPPAGFTGEDRITVTVTDNGKTNGSDDFKSDTSELILDVLDFVPSTFSGFVYFDADGDGQIDARERGISGTVVTLTGVDFQGTQVSLSTRTDANGFYEFTNLAPGEYDVQQQQPAFTLDGVDTLGSQGGTQSNDKFSFEIGILGGVFGMNNNFGESSLRPSLFSVRDLIASQQGSEGVLIALDGSGQLQWFMSVGGWDGADEISAVLNGSSTLDIIVKQGTQTHTRTVSLDATARLLGNSSLNGRVVRLQGSAADFGFSLTANDSDGAEGEGPEAAPEMQDLEMLARARHGRSGGAFAAAADQVFAEMS